MMTVIEPEVGRVYRVRLDDCCVQGEFFARLMDDTDDTFAFDNGVVLTVTSGVILTDVTTVEGGEG